MTAHRTFNLAFSAPNRDRKLENHCKLQDSLVTTTEHTEHKEREPKF